MGKILIKREHGTSGNLLKMTCFINNDAVCKLKENESIILEKESGTYNFNCKLSMNVMSDTYKIDLINNDFAEVDAKAGGWAPKATITYGKNSLSEIRSIELINNFNPTIKFGTLFFIDENNKLWAVPKDSNNPIISNVYSYDEIINFELIEDGNSISKGGIGRAIVGGALFGGVGAIVGGSTGKRTSKGTCSTLKIKITIKNTKNPAVFINIVTFEIKKNGMLYQKAYEMAQKIMSSLQVICDEVNNNDVIKNEILDIPNEIKKYKELLDLGAITQEEFDKKKKELLKL